MAKKNPEAQVIKAYKRTAKALLKALGKADQAVLIGKGCFTDCVDRLVYAFGDVEKALLAVEDIRWKVLEWKPFRRPAKAGQA